jgi:hypothetical protein
VVDSEKPSTFFQDFSLGDRMLDVLILYVFGMVVGAVLKAKKFNATLSILLIASAGAVFGYLLFQTLPFNLQSMWYILSLSPGLQMIWNQTHSIVDVAAAAKYVQYYAALIGVVSALLGYAVVALVFKVRKPGRRKH